MWKNHAEDLHHKLVPDSFLILVNNWKQPLHARNPFKKGILKEDHQKALKKLTLFFLLNPVPSKRQNYQKQKAPVISDQLLYRLQNKFRKIPLLVMYYLTTFCDIIQCSLSYSKNYICKFMQANSWQHKLFHFHLSFWIWKMWKGWYGKKL